MGYCHCDSCRHWSAAPVNAFTLWAPPAFAVLQGAAHIGTFNKTPGSTRKWCTVCGGHLFTEHPTLGLLEFDHVTFQTTITPDLRVKVYAATAETAAKLAAFINHQT